MHYEVSGFVPVHKHAVRGQHREKAFNRRAWPKNERFVTNSLTYPGRISARRQLTKSSESSFDAKTVLNDITIPGFNKIVDPHYSIIGKLFWCFIIVVSTVVCFYQIQKQIFLYYKIPIAVTVNVSRLPFVAFPAITVCPFYPFWYKKDISELKERYAKSLNISYSKAVDLMERVSHLKLIGFQKVTALQLWEMAGIKEQDINFTVLCGFGVQKNCERKIIKHSFSAFHARCITVKLDADIEFDGAHNGIQVDINTHENEDFYWRFTLLLHDRNDDSKHVLFSNVGQNVHHNFETRIIYFLKQFQHVNSSVNRCQSRKDYQDCFINCIESRLRSNVTCRLPFLDDSRIPLCINSVSAEYFGHKAEILYENVNKECSYCVHRCKENIYNMIQDVIRIQNKTVIKILLSDNIAETVIEHESYTFQALLADVGGNLGLFLGFCLLTILQLFEIFIFKVNVCLNK